MHLRIYVCDKPRENQGYSICAQNVDSNYFAYFTFLKFCISQWILNCTNSLISYVRQYATV